MTLPLKCIPVFKEEDTAVWSGESMEGLFREEVLRARRPQWLGTVRLSTPISHQLWGLVAAFTTAAILLWLCLGQYPRREHVAGQLSPASGMLTVSSSGGGTVTRVLVREGAPVIAGQPLAELSGNSVSVRMGDTHAAVDYGCKVSTKHAAIQVRGIRMLTMGVEAVC